MWPVCDSLQQILIVDSQEYALPGVCGVSMGKSLINGHCFNYRVPELNEFPPLRLRLDGTRCLPFHADYAPGSDDLLTIDPSAYLVRQVSVEGPVYCLAITSSGMYLCYEFKNSVPK